MIAAMKTISRRTFLRAAAAALAAAAVPAAGEAQAPGRPRSFRIRPVSSAPPRPGEERFCRAARFAAAADAMRAAASRGFAGEIYAE